uniref:Uncharacterized protein n=1 Tax=Arundo donax TaxID=35708 RepID=A0A0A9AY59_ARUDO
MHDDINYRGPPFEFRDIIGSKVCSEKYSQ